MSPFVALTSPTDAVTGVMLRCRKSVVYDPATNKVLLPLDVSRSILSFYFDDKTHFVTFRVYWQRSVTSP